MGYVLRQSCIILVALKLSCYLGPSTDVGPAMITKIFTENDQVLHILTLTPEELLDKDVSDSHEQFMARVPKSFEQSWRTYV